MLFLASLAVTLLILWLYNLTVLVGKKMLRAKKLKGQTPQISLVSEHTHGRNMQMASSSVAQNATVNGPLMTSWTGRIESRDDYRPREDISQGSTLSSYLARKDAEKRSFGDWQHNNARPSRDDRSYLQGSAYRPSPATQSRKSNGTVVPKPWGW